MRAWERLARDIGPRTDRSYIKHAIERANGSRWQNLGVYRVALSIPEKHFMEIWVSRELKSWSEKGGRQNDMVPYQYT